MTIHIFKDILELCDSVLLINSGVGVTAMMYQKPVYYFGDIFYGHNSLNRAVSSSQEVANFLMDGSFKVDFEKVKRLISYLVEDFYSFGVFHTRLAKEKDSSKRTITEKIEFYQVKMLPQKSKTQTLLVTDVKFWERDVGNKARIYNLIMAIHANIELVVVFIGDVSRKDRKKVNELKIGYCVQFLEDIEIEETFNIYLSPPGNTSLSRFFNIEYKKKFVYFVKKNNFDNIIIEYIRLDYLLDGLEINSKKIIDTHDLFFIRTKIYRENRLIDYIEVTKEEEFAILKKYDTILAIQKNEKKMLDENFAHKTLLVSHYAPAKNLYKNALEVIKIGFISGRANIEHLRWFLNNVWHFFQQYPSIYLHIYGSISVGRRTWIMPKNCRLNGIKSNIEDIYQNINLAINPVRYGSGLKIKNVEALAYGIPLITTDEGANGIEDGINKAFLLANAVDEWIDAILMLSFSPTLRKMLSESAFSYAKKNFGKEVYYSLLNTLKQKEIDT